MVQPFRASTVDWRRRLEDAGGEEPVDLFVITTEQIARDGPGVLAELRSLVHVGTDHVLTAERAAVEPQRSDTGLVDLHREPARLELRIAHLLRAGEHRRRGDALTLARRGDIVLGARRGPGTDVLVELVGARPPAVDGCERAVARPRGVAHRGDQSLPIAIIATRDRDPLFLTRAAVQAPRCAHLAAVAEW